MRRDGWQLAANTPRPVEKTQNIYRFRVEVAPHQTVELDVAERRALMNRYLVSNLKSQDIELFVSERYLDDAARAALEKIISIKGLIAGSSARIEAIDQEVAAVGTDQARLRENIKALGQTADAQQLIARYIAKAGEQETLIEQLAIERKQKASEQRGLQNELAA